MRSRYSGRRLAVVFGIAIAGLVLAGSIAYASIPGFERRTSRVLQRKRRERERWSPAQPRQQRPGDMHQRTNGRHLEPDRAGGGNGVDRAGWAVGHLGLQPLRPNPQPRHR
jgi:hypothetical protein